VRGLRLHLHRARPPACAVLRWHRRRKPGRFGELPHGSWRRIAKRTFDQYRADGITNLAAALDVPKRPVGVPRAHRGRGSARGVRPSTRRRSTRPVDRGRHRATVDGSVDLGTASPDHHSQGRRRRPTGGRPGGCDLGGFGICGHVLVVGKRDLGGPTRPLVGIDQWPFNVAVTMRRWFSSPSSCSLWSSPGRWPMPSVISSGIGATGLQGLGCPPSEPMIVAVVTLMISRALLHRAERQPPQLALADPRRRARRCPVGRSRRPCSASTSPISAPMRRPTARLGAIITFLVWVWLTNIAILLGIRARLGDRT